MSNYFGFPVSTDFSAPQQPPHSAMIVATPGLTANGGYSLPLAPMHLAAPAAIPQMPSAVAPAAAAIPYMSTYTGVYTAAEPVQPMAYAMQQMPMQQQQIPMFAQQTALYQPQMHLTAQAMSQPPPMSIHQQQQQQHSWQQPIQQPSTSAAMPNYHSISQVTSDQQLQMSFRPQQQQQQQQSFRPSQPQQQQQQSFRPSQPQQQQSFRPSQPQQQQSFRPSQPQQQQSFKPSQPQQQQSFRPSQPQQQQSFRPSQPQQQQLQRPALRPRVPSAAGQRPPLPSSTVTSRPPAGASSTRPSQPFSSMGRMRAPLGLQHAQLKPAPLFGKPNLRVVPSIPSSTVSGVQRQTVGSAHAAGTKAGSESEDLQHCPPIPGGVGTEYVIQVRTELRGAAALQYHCRLCDCRFTDVQARDLHVKGRRHRLQYKRKVDPRLAVDAKPSVKARHGGLSTQDSVAAAAAAVPSESANEAAMRRRREEEQRMRDMQELEWSNYAGCKHGGFWGGGAGQPRRPESNDDRQVLAKHSSVYPTEAELLAVQQLVTRCERALKLASDQLSTEAEAPSAAPLRGVMRVGALAKGLLLHGDLATQLVLLCAAWPTKELRNRVMHLLPERLEADGVTGESSAGDEQQQPQQKIEVRLDEEDGCIQVHGCAQSESEGGGLNLTCSVYLTSPAVREEATDNPEPEDALDRDKCLEALAALRQAKWFQAKASSLQSCVPVIRVLRDMCQRLPIWGPLPEWAMELLVERSISSASGGQLLSPGDAVRRVMECLASGILLANGPGLRDPCEKVPVDAAASMTAQEREDVTASAQQALRLIALRRMHQVLDMAPLVPPPTPSGDNASKAALVAAASKRPSSAAASVAVTAAKQARMGQ